MDNSSDNKQQIFRETIHLLSKILDLDEESTLSHGLRVAELSQAIARQLSHDKPGQLFIAGLLHDIGGVSLDKHILHHARDGFQDMESRQHSTRGANILKSFHPFQTLAGWVADHHERYDGTGFPEGKSRHNITSEGGIIHLADLLDIFIRSYPQSTLADIRKFLNNQSAASVSPVIVEAAKRIFSTQENIALLKKNTSDEIFCSTFDVDSLEIDSISVPELISQLLWLIAQVPDCKRTGREFHSNRVAFYCHRVAKTFNSLDVDPIHALWAGLLHDIGLRSVSVQELKKEPSVLAKESLLYRQHPLVSAELVATVKALEHFAPAIAAHHENLDGTGFPKGLTKSELPLIAQIISICDRYDILAGEIKGEVRVGHQHAINELKKGRGHIFSPELLDSALPVLEIWGPRNISWMRDVKNVHAFFMSDPFSSLARGEEGGKKKERSAKAAFAPRQWTYARLASDFSFIQGAEAVCALAENKVVENFFAIVATSVVTDTCQPLSDLQIEQSLTFSLPAKQGKLLELIFIRQKYGYDLLYRGVNETPLFTRKYSLFYQHFRKTPEAELLLDQKAIVKDVNKSGVTLLGFSKQALIGKELETLFSPFLSKPQLRSFHRFMGRSSEDIWSEEFSLVNEKGKSYGVQVTLERLLGIDDQQLTYLCRLRDITARKKMEQDMFHRDRALQLIVHNISGLTGKFFFRSLLQQFATLTKSGMVMVGELVDQGEAIQPISFQQQNRFLHKEKYLLPDSPSRIVVQRGEIFFPRRLQEFFPLDQFLHEQEIHSYWGLPLRSQDGTIIGVLVAMDGKELLHSKSIRAIIKVLQSLAGSELSRMQTARILQENEKQLESQNRDLVRMNQLKSDMIAVTSHDLKSPLAAIIGYADLLKEFFSTMEEEKKIHYIKRIEEEGQKQLAFINKLLDLYRIESGSIDLELAPKRLDLLISDCIVTQQHVAAANTITISFAVKGKPAPILLDQLRMDQVFSNLLSNAVKFSPVNENIEVRYSQVRNLVIVEICDRGKGIDEEEIVNIFDRYYMGRTNFDIRPEGSGLGLYIVKNIISLHGGKVFAGNRKKGGSCFTVQIPY
ncbi:MAG: HD domain-containing protein [Thermodesulfobacteriota bacterium]|nr:HD domain-containing protein [Thermodesulfobacteriota bacterium]